MDSSPLTPQALRAAPHSPLYLSLGKTKAEFSYDQMSGQQLKDITEVVITSDGTIKVITQAGTFSFSNVVSVTRYEDYFFFDFAPTAYNGNELKDSIPGLESFGYSCTYEETHDPQTTPPTSKRQLLVVIMIVAIIPAVIGGMIYLFANASQTVQKSITIPVIILAAAALITWHIKHRK